MTDRDADVIAAELAFPEPETPEEHYAEQAAFDAVDELADDGWPVDRGKVVVWLDALSRAALVPAPFLKEEKHG